MPSLNVICWKLAKINSSTKSQKRLEENEEGAENALYLKRFQFAENNQF